MSCMFLNDGIDKVAVYLEYGKPQFVRVIPPLSSVDPGGVDTVRRIFPCFQPQRFWPQITLRNCVQRPSE